MNITAFRMSQAWGIVSYFHRDCVSGIAITLDCWLCANLKSVKVETPKPPDRFWHLANDRQNDTGDSGEDWEGAEKSMRVRTLRENGELKCAHQVLGVPWRSSPSTLLDARKQWWQHERKKREEGWREERWSIGRGKREGGVTKEVELIKQTDSLMDKHYNFLE